MYSDPIYSPEGKRLVAHFKIPSDYFKDDYVMGIVETVTQGLTYLEVEVGNVEFVLSERE